MDSPNKTFILDKGFDHLFGHTHMFVVIAASDRETAAKHIKKTLYLDIDPFELVWLMTASYITIYDQKRGETA